MHAICKEMRIDCVFIGLPNISDRIASLDKGDVS